MTREEIVERLRNVMKQSCPQAVDLDSVTFDTMIATLGFDSLSMLDLIYDIQQEFGVEFEAERMVGISTVGQLVDFLLNEITA